MNEEEMQALSKILEPVCAACINVAPAITNLLLELEKRKHAAAGTTPDYKKKMN